LDQRLATNTFIAGEHYTIADMAIWPWYGDLRQLYGAGEFLRVQSYKKRGALGSQIGARPRHQRPAW
jgi:GST-like protein